MFVSTKLNKNIFNFKKKIKYKDEMYSKNMKFIKNNLVVGEYE